MIFPAVFPVNRVAVKAGLQTERTSDIETGIVTRCETAATAFTQTSETGTLYKPERDRFRLDRWTDCRYKPVSGKLEPECVFR